MTSWLELIAGTGRNPYDFCLNYDVLAAGVRANDAAFLFFIFSLALNLSSGELDKASISLGLMWLTIAVIVGR